MDIWPNMWSLQLGQTGHDPGASVSNACFRVWHINMDTALTGRVTVQAHGLISDYSR